MLYSIKIRMNVYTIIMCLYIAQNNVCYKTNIGARALRAWLAHTTYLAPINILIYNLHSFIFVFSSSSTYLNSTLLSP